MRFEVYKEIELSYQLHLSRISDEVVVLSMYHKGIKYDLLDFTSDGIKARKLGPGFPFTDKWGMLVIDNVSRRD